MGKHLWPLLRLQASSEEALIGKYRDVYLEHYVRDKQGNDVSLFDWQGKRIHFHAGMFKHAFSESSDYRFKASAGHDIVLSPNRARRVLWIKEVLTASAGTIERRSTTRKDRRNRPQKRRILLVTEESYVVILEQRPGRDDFDFITAYVADPGALEKIKLESALLEIKTPQS